MKPPELITPASYSNWMPFELVQTPAGLAIGVRPTPRKAIGWTTALLGVVCFGLCLGVFNMAASADLFWVFTIGGLLTTAGTPYLIVMHFQGEQRLGPVLVFDAQAGTVELPRSGRRFRRDELDCLCVVTGESVGDWVSQLQLHTRQGECFLLVPADTRKELDPIVKGLAAATSLPVRVFKEDGKAPDKWREQVYAV